MVSSHADRTVLVTGGNSGIGAAIVRAFAREGARIGLHFLDAASAPISGVEIGHTGVGREGAEIVADQARTHGAAVALVPANLADPEAIGPLYDAVESALGAVDILVNNAAHFENPRPSSMSPPAPSIAISPSTVGHRRF
jgi:3-oxoacyl-[acyl-carrier protein] reductase